MVQYFSRFHKMTADKYFCKGNQNFFLLLYPKKQKFRSNQKNTLRKSNLAVLFTFDINKLEIFLLF